MRCRQRWRGYVGLAVLSDGFYGQFLAQFDIKVTYTWLGIAVAMAFTSIPFVVRTVQPVLEELGPEYEEAAQTLGATRLQSFAKSCCLSCRLR